MLIRLRDSASLGNIVAYMRDFADQSVGDEEFLVFARSIVADSPWEGFNQLSAVLDYVRRTVRYQPDPDGTELFTTPHRMMLEAQEAARTSVPAMGDCDDIAIFCVAICRTLGYTSRVVLLDQNGNGFNHAAAEVLSDPFNEWFYMDPTRPERLTVASPRKYDEPGSPLVGTPQYKVKLEIA